MALVLAGGPTAPSNACAAAAAACSFFLRTRLIRLLSRVLFCLFLSLQQCTRCMRMGRRVAHANVNDCK